MLHVTCGRRSDYGRFRQAHWSALGALSLPMGGRWRLPVYCGRIPGKATTVPELASCHTLVVGCFFGPSGSLDCMVWGQFRHSFVEFTLYSGPNRDVESWRRMMVHLIRSVDGGLGIMGVDRAWRALSPLYDQSGISLVDKCPLRYLRPCSNTCLSISEEALPRNWEDEGQMPLSRSRKIPNKVWLFYFGQTWIIVSIFIIKQNRFQGESNLPSPRVDTNPARPLALNSGRTHNYKDPMTQSHIHIDYMQSNMNICSSDPFLCSKWSSFCSPSAVQTRLCLGPWRQSSKPARSRLKRDTQGLGLQTDPGAGVHHSRCNSRLLRALLCSLHSFSQHSTFGLECINR